MIPEAFRATLQRAVQPASARPVDFTGLSDSRQWWSRRTGAGLLGRAGNDMHASAGHAAESPNTAASRVRVDIPRSTDDHRHSTKVVPRSWQDGGPISLASDTEADLLAALVTGRAWTASLSRYRGSLDLLADSTCPMCSASVSVLPTRQVSVIATGLSTGDAVQVVQGVVDYAGSSVPAPSCTAVVATLTPSDLTAGSVTLAVDCSSSSFVRTQVLDSSGAVVAVSNPFSWLLREMPPAGITTPRQR